MKKIKSFFKGVRKEAKVVRWPDGKTLVKYSCITIVMLVFFGLYFYGLTFGFSLLTKLVSKLVSLIGGLF